MSKEVSGQPEGTTLLECINAGIVPYPERMPYVRWLEWRKETGSRPVKRRDGRSTSTAEEVALWRSVMEFLHDVTDEDEDEEEEEEDDEEESPPLEPVDDADGPELIPDAGNGLSEAAALEQAAARAAAAAPTAGATGLAAAGDSALAVVPLSADRRAGLSGPPSTAGSVPATAESLQADLPEMFRPDQESVADYLTRISRIVLALRAHGVVISSAELDGLAMKASLLNAVCESLWRASGQEVALDPAFDRLLCLIGKPRRVEGWFDSEGEACIAHRRGLRKQGVLATFKCLGEGHWTTAPLTAKIVVDESKKARTLCFVGDLHREQCVVLELLTQHLVLTKWDHLASKVKVKVDPKSFAYPIKPARTFFVASSWRSRLGTPQGSRSLGLRVPSGLRGMRRSGGIPRSPQPLRSPRHPWCSLLTVSLRETSA